MSQLSLPPTADFTFLKNALVALFVLTMACDLASAATRYDPRLRFRTMSTKRFDIHYHQGEEALAQRLARIAEEVATALGRTLGPADGRVQVILVDQNDQPNGWATPLPYNTIEISVATPAADSIIGNVDDWLRLVFTHEYTHVVHLSRAQGWIGGLRKVFGRLPILYPNVFQPIWQIEGIATWEESTQTGQGRVPQGDFRIMLDRAATEKRFDPLDRASSRLVDWPSGNTPYLYGAYFHQYLADTYGAEALRRLTDETSRRLPYLGSRAFRKVFGRSLGELWNDFEASVAAQNPPRATADRLTHHGFSVTSPRFDQDGRLYYSLFDPHRFPALMELDLATRQSRPITTRYFGNRLGVAGDTLIFDQIEIVRNVGRQSDLYAVSRGGGRARRISYGARAADPDVSPDASKIVFTVQRADRRELATAPLAPAFQFMPVTLASTVDVSYASPRWSPDGRLIVAERRALGGPSEIVVVDAATGSHLVLVPQGRNATPIWSPDGTTVFFAAALGDAAFQIFSVPSAGGEIRRLAGTGPHAFSPAIAPDGRSLVFVGYTADGYDLFSMSLATAQWEARPAVDERPQAAGEPPAPALTSREYSPLGTILPRSWTPTFESDEGEIVVGAATASIDALARHGYAAEAGWSRSRARPDWQIAYGYDRWQPFFYAVASDDTDPWRGGERRTIEADAGMLLAFRKIRWTQSVLAELHTSSERFDCDSGAASCLESAGLRVTRHSIRSGISLDSARMFGYSISLEEGGRIGATLESIRSGSGDASGLAATIDVRRYVRAWPRHAAVAIRAAAAASWGDDGARRMFSAAGSDPQPGGFRFGADAIGLIRGLEEDRVFGTRAAVINLDYRLPIVDIQRGVGTLPVFLKAVHGAVFFDAGHAWAARFRASGIRRSAGAELSMDTVLAYVAPLTFAVGGAWRSGPDADDRGFAAFARIGRAF